MDRTLIHNPSLRERELRLPELPVQNPVVLQLGGSDPRELRHATKLAAGWGYDEINLNCGCPSPKVAGKGCFGAALMKEPELVRECVREMKEVSEVEVTVKCRIGVDDSACYENLREFIEVVSEGGVKTFIVHARKAILAGLSPAQNRTVPPLRYDYVYRLVRDFPGLNVVINGGIQSMEEIQGHLEHGVSGAMVGRLVMNRPWAALADVDVMLYGAERDMRRSRRNVLWDYVEYAEREMVSGCSVRQVVKPVVNLFQGEANGKRWRRKLDEGFVEGWGVRDVVRNGMEVLGDDVLDALPNCYGDVTGREAVKESVSYTDEGR